MQWNEMIHYYFLSDRYFHEVWECNAIQCNAMQCNDSILFSVREIAIFIKCDNAIKWNDSLFSSVRSLFSSGVIMQCNAMQCNDFLFFFVRSLYSSSVRRSFAAKSNVIPFVWTRRRGKTNSRLCFIYIWWRQCLRFIDADDYGLVGSGADDYGLVAQMTSA